MKGRAEELIGEITGSNKGQIQVVLTMRQSSDRPSQGRERTDGRDCEVDGYARPME